MNAYLKALTERKRQEFMKTIIQFSFQFKRNIIAFNENNYKNKILIF